MYISYHPVAFCNMHCRGVLWHGRTNHGRNWIKKELPSFFDIFISITSTPEAWIIICGYGEHNKSFSYLLFPRLPKTFDMTFSHRPLGCIFFFLPHVYSGIAQHVRRSKNHS